MKYTVIIPSAGHSTRFSKTKDKLLAKINNEKIIIYSITYFLEDHDCQKIIIPTSEKNFKLFKQMFCLNSKVLVVKGSYSRAQSVKNGFQYLDKNCEKVLIHDGARPFVTNELISDIKNSFTDEYDCVIPYIDIYDSLFNVNQKKYVNRDEYKIIQTPQAFNKNVLEEVYKNINDIDDYNDELSLAMKINNKLKVNFITGCPKNKKITVLSDLE